jgi:hypothetical protein
MREGGKKERQKKDKVNRKKDTGFTMYMCFKI